MVPHRVGAAPREPGACPLTGIWSASAFRLPPRGQSQTVLPLCPRTFSFLWAAFLGAETQGHAATDLGGPPACPQSGRPTVYPLSSAGGSEPSRSCQRLCPLPNFCQPPGVTRSPTVVSVCVSLTTKAVVLSFERLLCIVQPEQGWPGGPGAGQERVPEERSAFWPSGWQRRSSWQPRGEHARPAIQCEE